MPVLRNLYEHVKDELPKKGQKRRKSEAKAEGDKLTERPPRIPPLVKTALDQFYDHYRRTYEGERGTLFDTPPVFIIVCNNTSVSKDVFKYMAGYEVTNEETGETMVVPGQYDLLSNFDLDPPHRPRRRPPTLLIDSDALENSDQVDTEFRRVFQTEIEDFKREYARLYGQGAVEDLTDAKILREVVNTVGEPKKLGAHVRCVVSVSMLTEGWDANTVTHIMGLRAFGSQLLCEQVAGRALRRRDYHLVRYDKQGNINPKGTVEKYPPEYAHIIGVPFKLFKGGETATLPPPEYTNIYALPERQDEYEITFPNVDGYRVESIEGEITADFSQIENFEIDGSRFPLETTMATAFMGETQQMTVASAKGLRDQQIVYWITKWLLHFYYSDEEGRPYFQKFNKLRHIVETWYHTKVLLIGHTDPDYKRVLIFFETKRICDHIKRGIDTQQSSTDQVVPIFNYYNKFGSTKYVHGQTSKPVYPTEKSHVNYVVADTQKWEQIAAKTLEELDEVEAYVKNEFLGFSFPYLAEDGEEHRYFPDFIARCRTADGRSVNLIIEVTGMNRDKAVKKWYVEYRWLPAVNAVRSRYAYDEWDFIEVANDIRDIKNQLFDKIRSL